MISWPLWKIFLKIHHILQIFQKSFKKRMCEYCLQYVWIRFVCVIKYFSNSKISYNFWTALEFPIFCLRKIKLKNKIKEKYLTNLLMWIAMLSKYNHGFKQGRQTSRKELHAFSLFICQSKNEIFKISHRVKKASFSNIYISCVTACDNTTYRF